MYANTRSRHSRITSQKRSRSGRRRPRCPPGSRWRRRPGVLGALWRVLTLSLPAGDDAGQPAGGRAAAAARSRPQPPRPAHRLPPGARRSPRRLSGDAVGAAPGRGAPRSPRRPRPPAPRRGTGRYLCNPPACAPTSWGGPSPRQTYCPHPTRGTPSETAFMRCCE